MNLRWLSADFHEPFVQHLWCEKLMETPAHKRPASTHALRDYPVKAQRQDTHADRNEALSPGTHGAHAELPPHWVWCLGLGSERCHLQPRVLNVAHIACDT